MMTIISQARAEKRNSPIAERNHARRRSYVALLFAGPRGSIDRKFVEREKDGTRIRFRVEHQPGDIFEIRRWLWDAVRETFMGGAEWIGFDEKNEPFLLTRDEAFASVLASQIANDAPAASSPAFHRAERILPADIVFSAP